MKTALTFSTLFLYVPLLTAQTVTGAIVDQFGKGLPGLQATLFTQPGQYTTTTGTDGSFLFDNITGVREESPVPAGYFISQNYPNPFNPKTRFHVTLPAAGKLRVSVYNVLGQKVVRDREEDLGAGRSDIDLEMKGLSSGVYLARISLDDSYAVTMKLLLIYGSQHLTASDADRGDAAVDVNSAQRSSVLYTRLDSLVVSGESIVRTTFAPLPDLTGNSLDLGHLVVNVTAPASPTLSFPPDGAVDQSTSPTLSWNPGNAGTTYRLQISLSDSFTAVVYDEAGLTQASAGLVGLNISTRYYWRVRATNDYGTSAWSAAWSFITKATASDQLFIYQGAYASLGSVEQIAQLVALHDYVVVTHGFYLDGSMWVNGNCLDVNYVRMPELLVRVRQANPAVKIFAYVAATADHPNGCWPQPSVQMADCPRGDCSDFKTWTDLWLTMERDYTGVIIDGIFVDLVHPALIGANVRDSVFSYVKSRSKLIMANALSDTIGLVFAVSSPYLEPEDYVLVEGYSTIAGYPNGQTAAMNRIMQNLKMHWAAVVSEASNAPVSCDSENFRTAYGLFRQYRGTAMTYQSADLGTQTGTWIYCDHPPK